MQRNRRLKRMERRRRNELLQDLTPLMVVVLAIQPAIDLTEHVNVTSGFELKGDLNEGGPMKRLACVLFLALWFGASLAVAQQQPRYPVDPDTKWATGANQRTADQLKKQLAAGAEVLIIDVRAPASFEKETLPGAINIPLDQLGAYLPTIPKDKTLVFT